MARSLIDLSMPVHNDMVVFPRVVRPALVMYETWQEFAERVGAAKFGATSLTASCMIVLGDHVGTHIDSLRHIRETAGGPEAIPIDYCYGDGVVLDFRHLPLGAGISVEDVKSALTKIEYTLKPLDIVLIHTGAGKLQDSEKYLTDQVGMTGESTEWMLDQGIKVMGIDAITFDPPDLGDVRAQEVLGGASRDGPPRVLPPREHDQLPSPAAARVQAVGVSGQVGEHHGGSGPGRGHPGGLKWRALSSSARSTPRGGKSSSWPG